MVSSFSTAGQNANFSSESAKDSQGTTQKDGSKGPHALLSGISLNWTLTNKVWDVTASIGIDPVYCLLQVSILDRYYETLNHCLL